MSLIIGVILSQIQICPRPAGINAISILKLQISQQLIKESLTVYNNSKPQKKTD